MEKEYGKDHYHYESLREKSMVEIQKLLYPLVCYGISWKCSKMEAQEKAEKWFRENHPYFKAQEPQKLHPDFEARVKRGDYTQLDYLNNLSYNYGFTKRHPRTSEMITFQTSEVAPTNLIRKGSVKYKPQTRSIGIGNTYGLQKGKWQKLNKTPRLTVGSTEKEIRNANRKRWKTVWYSRHQRRK